jgi:hypothetical protein
LFNSSHPEILVKSAQLISQLIQFSHRLSTMPTFHVRLNGIEIRVAISRQEWELFSPQVEITEKRPSLTASML